MEETLPARLPKRSDVKDILITLPATTSWEEYEKELLTVADGNSVMNFRVSTAPKQPVIGGRCFLVHKGKICGWMEIVGIQRGPFVCTTTGREWPEGVYLQRSGEFHKLEPPVAHPGFQGWRYYDSSIHA